MPLPRQSLRHEKEKWKNFAVRFLSSLKRSQMVQFSPRNSTNVDYTDLSTKSTEGTRMLSEIVEMQKAITDLKNAQEQSNTDQNLPLPESIALLNSHKAKRDQLAIALERQTQENSKKKREVEKLRAQLAEMEKRRVDAEMFAREAERSKNAENTQAEMATKKQVGWWYVSLLKRLRKAESYDLNSDGVSGIQVV